MLCQLVFAPVIAVFSVQELTDYRKQHRGSAVPDGRVALPEKLLSVFSERDRAKLRSAVLRADAKELVFNSIYHMFPSRSDPRATDIYLL